MVPVRRDRPGSHLGSHRDHQFVRLALLRPRARLPRSSVYVCAHRIRLVIPVHQDRLRLGLPARPHQPRLRPFGLVAELVSRL